jgi:hypothetical protein
MAHVTARRLGVQTDCAAVALAQMYIPLIVRMSYHLRSKAKAALRCGNSPSDAPPGICFDGACLSSR